MSVFLTILTMLTLSWIINEIYVNILKFIYGWTHNAPRIPKMYNITGIWSTDQKLLTVKPIATLREVIIMKWKTTEGEMKDIWRKSYIKKRPKGRWKIYDESHISTRSAEALKIYDWLTDSLTHKLLKILPLSWIINEVCVNTFIFLYIWMDSAPRILKMYKTSFVPDEHIPCY